MQKALTVVMYSVSENNHVYLYVHRTEKKSGRGRRTKVTFHPLSMVRCDTKHIEEDIQHFVQGYGVEDFNIHNTESRNVFLVQIHSGFPHKEGDVFNLRSYEKTLDHFHSQESLPGGFDDVEAIRDKLNSLVAKTVGNGEITDAAPAKEPVYA